jgi:isopenicillin N synthase-like dioxygenase
MQKPEEPSCTTACDNTQNKEGEKGTNWKRVPVVNISGLYSRNEDQRKVVAKEIGKACREVGFFYLASHPIPSSLIEQVYKAMKQFFSLPLEEKRKVAMTNCPEGHRGYFGLLEENTDTQNQGDVKEGIDFGHELPPEAPLLPLRGHNQWPQSLGEEFKAVVMQFFEAVRNLGNDLLRAFALDFDLPEDYFHHMFTPGLMILRMLHYPPQDVNAGSFNSKQIGCGEHTDYGCITLLHQDTPGLQVKNRLGEWVDAPPIADTFIVNLGDMMEKWTNSEYVATPHRVLNVSGGDRYSLPYFFEPNYDTIVRPLPTCTGAGEGFKPIIYGHHLTQKLDATYPHRQQPQPNNRKIVIIKKTTN